MEFNRLSPFLEEREDLRAGQIASAIYNVNIVEKSALTKPSDFMLPTIDEMIQKEVEQKEQEKAAETLDPDDAQLAWNGYLKRLLHGRKPVENTVQG